MMEGWQLRSITYVIRLRDAWTQSRVSAPPRTTDECLLFAPRKLTAGVGQVHGIGEEILKRGHSIVFISS